MQSPHLGTFQEGAKLFALRMRAHLALGDSAGAYRDFSEILHGYRQLDSEPTFLTGLVQNSMLGMVYEGVGDGLKAHAWKEPELRNIAADLATVSAWSIRQRTLNGERAFFNSTSDLLTNSSPTGRAALLGGIMAPLGTAVSSTALLALIPKRVIRDNQLRQNHYFDELLAQVDEDGFHPARATLSGPANLSSSTSRYYYFLSRITASAYSEALRRFTFTQTKLDLTRLAIALERYRLATGAFPKTLEELVPDWIVAVPLDSASRTPMAYHPEGNTFRLYGFGNNEIDDGGKVAERVYEPRQKDVIWLYAPAP